MALFNYNLVKSVFDKFLSFYIKRTKYMIMPVFNVKQKNEVNAGERRENCSYKFYYGDNLNVPKLLHSIFPENGSSKTIVQFSLVCNIFIF